MALNMADFDYYTDVYLGTELTEKEYPALARQAGAVLDRYCRDYRVEGGEDAKAMALCAMAEVLHRLGDRQGVASATVGGVSVRYMGNRDKELHRELYRAASIYLDIYRGVGA